MAILSRLSPVARKVVSVVFLLGLLWLGARMCRSEISAAEIAFRVEAGGEHLRRLEVRLHRPGEDEIVGMFRRFFDSGTHRDGGTWPLTIDGGEYVLDIELATEGGITSAQRRVVIADGARVTVPLEVPEPKGSDRGAEEGGDAGPPADGDVDDAGRADGVDR